MAICPQCRGEMMDGISCNAESVTILGRDYELIRYGEERYSKRYPAPDHCRDCRTPLGGVHHPGCCVERCPVCLGQAFGCPCFDEPRCDAVMPHPHQRCVDHLFRRQRPR